MPDAKHIDIAKALEKDILSGRYTDRIPSVLALAGEYGVARQTITKALRPLISRRLLLPSPRGTRINPEHGNRPCTGIVGIYCLEAAAFSGDPMVSALADIIVADGMEPLFMSNTRASLIHNRNFWASNFVDGYVFVYCSFNRAFTDELKELGVPFVVANRIPDDFGASWVDWDLAEVFDTILGELVAGGAHDVALHIPVPSRARYTFDLIRDDFVQAKKLYQLSNPMLDAYQIENSDDPTEYGAFLLSQPRFPEAVISWGSADELVGFLQYHGKIVGRDYKLVATHYSHPEVNGVWTLVGLDKTKLAKAIWRTFRRVRNAPFGNALQIRVAPPFKLVSSPRSGLKPLPEARAMAGWRQSAN